MREAPSPTLALVPSARWAESYAWVQVKVLQGPGWTGSYSETKQTARPHPPAPTQAIYGLSTPI